MLNFVFTLVVNYLSINYYYYYYMQQHCMCQPCKVYKSIKLAEGLQHWLSHGTIIGDLWTLKTINSVEANIKLLYSCTKYSINTYQHFWHIFWNLMFILKLLWFVFWKKTSLSGHVTNNIDITFEKWLVLEGREIQLC